MISLVATVRGPRADLDRFIAYHFNTGVCHIYLFFDDPDDPAVDAFCGLEQLTSVACTPKHWRDAGLTASDGIEARQLHNANLAMAWARARGAQWLLHVDSDELIATPGDDIAAWLARRPAEVDAVVFPALEAIPRASGSRHPFESCRLFKVRPSDPKRLELANRMGCRQALRYGYFRGHMAGKSATRVTSEIRSVGIHVPDGGAGGLRLETAQDAYLLHYDGCTFEAWRRKWAGRKDGTAIALNMRPDRRRQFDDFLTADQLGSLAVLEHEFRRQCLIPLHEQATLWALGLARFWRLRDDLFGYRLR